MSVAQATEMQLIITAGLFETNVSDYGLAYNQSLYN